MARITLLLTLLVLSGAAALLFAILWVRDRRRIARLESERARLRQELDRATSGRESFFDLVTHELRSPLSAILGYQELLRDSAYGALPDHAAEPIVRIGRSAQHLLHLIDGVVELSRIRSGTVRLDLDDVPMSVVVSSLADGFRVMAGERGIPTRLHLPDSLPTIRSDQDRIVRTLDLLVTSAVKHPGGAELALDVAARPEGVAIRISGMELAPLTDSDELPLRLGLRLAVADGVADALGGSLQLEADETGVIRALTLDLRDLAAPPPPAL